MSERVVVGLGANIGDRLATMRAAVRELSQISCVVQVSRVYATAPVGKLDQPEFLNAAALVEYDGDCLGLFDALVAIEARLGRVRGERWGPRVIDLDILWAGNVVIETPRLAVPHPRLRERAFALVPLLELVPEPRDPRTGQPYVVPPGEVRVTTDGIVQKETQSAATRSEAGRPRFS